MLAGVAVKWAGAWKLWEALEHLGDTSAHRWVNGLHCSRRLNDFFFLSSLSMISLLTWRNSVFLGDLLLIRNE